MLPAIFSTSSRSALSSGPGRDRPGRYRSIYVTVLCGQEQPEGRARRAVIDQLEPAGMRLGNGSAQSQAEPCPAAFATAGAVRTGKPFEEDLAGGIGYSRPFVADIDAPAAGRSHPGAVDNASRWRLPEP